MNFRFWGNFLTVIGILGLTIFSLVTFTDQDLEDSQASNDKNYYIFLKAVKTGREVLRFFEDPRLIFTSDLFKKKTEDAEPVQDAIVPDSPYESIESESTDLVAEKKEFDLDKEVKAIKEALSNIKDPEWRSQELPDKISETWQDYSESSSDLMEEKGLFYRETEEGNIIGWRSASGKEYKIILP